MFDQPTNLTDAYVSPRGTVANPTALPMRKTPHSGA
jgi:hypothetical protein